MDIREGSEIGFEQMSFWFKKKKERKTIATSMYNLNFS